MGTQHGMPDPTVAKNIETGVLLLLGYARRFHTCQLIQIRLHQAERGGGAWSAAGGKMQVCSIQQSV